MARAALPRHLRCLLQDVVNEMRDDEADQRLEDHGGDSENARLLHHQPERLALEKEFESCQADEGAGIDLFRVARCSE